MEPENSVSTLSKKFHWRGLKHACHRGAPFSGLRARVCFQKGRHELLLRSCLESSVRLELVLFPLGLRRGIFRGPLSRCLP